MGVISHPTCVLYCYIYYHEAKKLTPLNQVAIQKKISRLVKVAT
jgi:hypothetical protein